MDFTVTAAPEGEGSIVRPIGNFLTTSPGSLGLAPSINGGSMMSKFVSLTTAADQQGLPRRSRPLSRGAAAAAPPPQLRLPGGAGTSGRRQTVSISTANAHAVGHMARPWRASLLHATCGTAPGPAPILAE